MLVAEGTVAVVTGGAHGIGKAYCEGLADAGAAVAVLDLDAAGAERVATAIRDRGGRAVGVAVDVADEGSVLAAVDKVRADLGPVDVLVNNAAMFSVVGMSRVGIAELSIAEWDKMMSVNVKGPWLMARAVLDGMVAKGRGKIVNISSGAAFEGTPSQAHYTTSKAAILGLTKCLARELGQYGITVNVIAPGATLSEEAATDADVALRSAHLGRRSIPRLQTPADLVGTLVYLCSPASDFVTGQTLVVDGGTYLH